MKKHGILNAELSRVIATMGHTDKLVICDSGLPIPRKAERIDLALVDGIPSFLDVVEAVLGELQVQEAFIACEMEKANGAAHQKLTKLLRGVEIKSVPHEEFKELTDGKGNITFVRTGEASPYANVILISGVTFD